ncbi:MAG: hypothetical protein HYZ49_20310 [Chloroflexi bacterium]|nr:hypothetical protein [Chloroflexota bacterium]
MKKRPNTEKLTDDMRAEYRFDYAKARPNRFANRAKDYVIVVLDPDVSQVFTTPDSVNTALRALINVMPKTVKRKPARKAQAMSHG